MNKPAVTRYPVHDLIRERWSPLAFSSAPLGWEEIGSLLEAARWAPSCFNEQPWRFFVATREQPERFEKLVSCLVPANRAWAEKAPVLMLSVARGRFARNDKPNRHAAHDVGLATAGLLVEAQARGLAVHAMAGFDGEQARELLGIPVDDEPMAMLAVGFPGDPEQLGKALRERENAPRQRLPLGGIAFGARWEEPPEAFA